MRLSGVAANAAEKATGTGSGAGFLGLPCLPTTNLEYASVFAASENYFQVLGIRLMVGRGFESMTGRDLMASPAVLISDNYWESRFSLNPGVLGRTIHLNQIPVTIIGMTPRDVVGTSVSAPNFWLPVSLEPLVHADENWLHNRENQQFRLYGRFAPGVTIGSAQAEANILAEYLRTASDRLCERRQFATGTRQIPPTRTPAAACLTIAADSRLFVFGISFTVGILFGLAPAIEASPRILKAEHQPFARAGFKMRFSPPK